MHRSTGVRRSAAAMGLVALVLAGWTAAQGAVSAAPSGSPAAMTPECHRAYRGYMEATDPEEADFWAESWMTFGCESGGYWA
jgi:hypothetical protein